MECFYLPNYSSESNPKERLNSDLKQASDRKYRYVPRRNGVPAANDHMTMLENNLGRVAPYFQDPHVKYAA